MSYHHYYPTLSGRLWATDEGICNTSETEAMRTQVQSAPASSSIKSTLHLDLSTSSSTSTSGKCNTIATSIERDPHRALLAAVLPIQPSSSSTAVDIYAAGDDDPSELPSTKSQTHAAEVRRASSSAPASHCVARSTLSYPTTLSSRSASRTRLAGVRRSM
jgi:hypothetical protein